MSGEKYGFFYMKTGAGHYSGAKSIAEKVKALNPDIDCVMCDGLEGVSFLTKLWLEIGYSASINYLPAAYLLFYHTTYFRFVQTLLLKILSPSNSILMRKKIRKEKFTKIISTHEILTPELVRICKELRLDIPVVEIVMDPFTAHPIWFYEKNTDVVVFSKYLKNVAIQKHKVAPEKVFLASPIFSEKFSDTLSIEKKQEVKSRLSIPLDEKIILIAGGGDGLKNAHEIVKYFLDMKIDAYIIVVCGKNKELLKKIEATVRKYNRPKILVFGFVNIMYELMQISDCIITKGGPGIIMEALSSQKPLIISSFVRYQEWGNLFFVKQNNCGWYLKKVNDIYKKVLEVLKEEKKINVDIKNGIADVANFIMNIS